MTESRAKKVCRYQDCERGIQPWFELCVPHYGSRKSGEIDECPSCDQYKDAGFPTCRDCHSPDKYKPEENPVWEAVDDEDDVFFVYILKLDGGKFYAGHTRELRERMSEHRDGKTRSTAGKNPRLVWFDAVDTRQEAAEGEAYLKKLIDTNEREVRRMVTEFLDLIREVDTGTDPADGSAGLPQPSGRPRNGPYRPRRLGYRR